MKKEDEDHLDMRIDSIMAVLCLIAAYVMDNWTALGFALISGYYFIKNVPWAIKVLTHRRT